MIELDLNTALKAAKAARHKANEMGVTISVAVVDESGRTIVIQRGDELGFTSSDFALGKAIAAAGFKSETKHLAEKWDDLNAFFTSALHAAPGGFMPATGAVPIYKDYRIIGAIGIGGAGPADDHLCAKAGAEAVRT